MSNMFDARPGFVVADPGLPGRVRTLEMLVTTGQIPAAAELAGQLFRELRNNDRRDDLFWRVAYQAAVVASLRRQDDGAEQLFRNVLTKHPYHPGCHYNLGVIQHRNGRLEDAIASYTSTLALKGTVVEAEINRAMCHMGLGRIDEAVALLDKAVSKPAGTADAHWVRAHANLLLGRWQVGWDDWEYRFKVPGFMHENQRPLPGRRLKPDGLAVNRLKVYLHPEQGMGDIVMAMGAFRELADRYPGNTYVIETQPALARLFSGSFPYEVRQWGVDPVPNEINWWHVGVCSLMPMAGWCGEPKLAYLTPTRRLPPPTRRRIGLAWRGNADHKHDSMRSMALTHLYPVLQWAGEQGLEVVAIQRDAISRAEWDAVPFPGERVWGGAILQTMDDTAALLQTCDALVTVDTGTVHVAGATGVHTLMLNYAMTDWRWGIKGPGSLSPAQWYESVTEWRQPQVFDWSQAAPTAIEFLKAAPVIARQAAPVIRAR